MEKEIFNLAKQAQRQLRTGADLQTIQAAQTRLDAYESVIRLVRQETKFAFFGEL